MLSCRRAKMPPRDAPYAAVCFRFRPFYDYADMAAPPSPARFALFFRRHARHAAGCVTPLAALPG
jgi:hypothetical protein